MINSTAVRCAGRYFLLCYITRFCGNHHLYFCCMWYSFIYVIILGRSYDTLDEFSKGSKCWNGKIPLAVRTDFQHEIERHTAIAI